MTEKYPRPMARRAATLTTSLADVKLPVLPVYLSRSEARHATCVTTKDTRERMAYTKVR